MDEDKKTRTTDAQKYRQAVERQKLDRQCKVVAKEVIKGRTGPIYVAYCGVDRTPHKFSLQEGTHFFGPAIVRN